MARGPLDFRFQGGFPIAGVAQVLANKRFKEEQLKNQREQLEQQKKQSRFSNIIQALQLGANLTQQGLAASATKQQTTARNALAEMVGRGNLPSFVGAGEAFGQEPLLRETPAFQSQLQGAAIRAGGSFGQAAAQDVFRKPVNPLDIEEQEARIAKLKTGRRGLASQQLLSEFATRKVLLKSGVSEEEINQGFDNFGKKIPKRLTVADANALRKKGGITFSFGNSGKNFADDEGI